METIRDAAGVSGAKAYDSQKVTAPEHNTVKEDRTEASVLKEQNNSQEKEQMPGVATAKNADVQKNLKELLEKEGGTKAVFGFHEDPDRVIIKFGDKDTKKVIQEFPSEKMLDYLQKVGERAGLLVDEKR